jgi:SAM-dependent methyltransferase
MKRKIFLAGPYFPKHEQNFMDSEGSVELARQTFMNGRFRNLDVLLRSRYAWMNRYLAPGKKVVEIGAGAGLSPFYLTTQPLLTDAALNPWIDKVIDATNMEFESDSVDVLIASHNIHHFYSPYKFFKECERVLNSDGILLIQELNTSLLMRGLLRLMRHEGWSYDVDVFDEHEIVNDERDLWSANCAVPELLFTEKAKFEQTFPRLQIQVNQPCECILFPLSGGVIAKTKVPEMPTFVLSLVLLLDSFLVWLAPNIFSLGRRVVIRKREAEGCSVL